MKQVIGKCFRCGKTIERGYTLCSECVQKRTKPDSVPVSVIEDIRSEIADVMKSESKLDTENAKAQYIALSWCLEIIDRTMAEQEEA